MSSTPYENHKTVKLLNSNTNCCRFANLSTNKLAKSCKSKLTGVNVNFMDTIEPLSSGNPLQRLLELTEEVFFAFHMQINKMVYLNAAFEKVWNLPREVVSNNLSLLLQSVHSDDRSHVADVFLTIQKERQKQSLEFRIQLSDQSVKWIKIDAYFSEKSNNEIILGTATDITGYKEYSDTLHKFSDKKNSILQILSHDLLGPLGNIQMSTFMLSEYAEISENKSIMEIINLINTSSKRSVTMIQDLINREFLQSSSVTLMKQRVDIVEKIQGMMDQYKQSPRATLQRFNVVTSVKSLFVTIDESKFMQALNNLLSNSLKFTGDDGNITISIEEQEKNILIKVQDTGIGIPADMQPFLFDKFTKARRTGLKGEPTNGLGMSIIKTIIEWHNGQIWFESTEEKGTTFYVEIPKNS